MNDTSDVVLLVSLCVLVAAVVCVPLGFFAHSIESDPDHMTQNERNACIRRIEHKLDILIERHK